MGLVGCETEGPGDRTNGLQHEPSHSFMSHSLTSFDMRTCTSYASTHLTFLMRVFDMHNVAVGEVRAIEWTHPGVVRRHSGLNPSPLLKRTPVGQGGGRGGVTPLPTSATARMHRFACCRLTDR